MAKKIETYQCEVCKRIYPTETEANGCEASHNKAVGIVRAIYTKDVMGIPKNLNEFVFMLQRGMTQSQFNKMFLFPFIK